MTQSNEAQLSSIRSHLKVGLSINPMEALRLYSCFRLGARIYDLRAEGMPILTTPTRIGDKNFATYSLTLENPNPEQVNHV